MKINGYRANAGANRFFSAEDILLGRSRQPFVISTSTLRRRETPLGKSLGAERNFGLLAFEFGHRPQGSASRAGTVSNRIWPRHNVVELR
jgi:hypothetical protein